MNDTEMLMYFLMIYQVLDVRYLGIEENQISKLTEGHLTSEGLR